MTSSRFRWSLAGLVLSVASPAWGSPGYPDELMSQLSLPKAPPCSVCHEHVSASDGGYDAEAGNAADTPFALALEARGLVGDSSNSLREALVPMVDVDSDGDGARDLDELYWGGDPNRPDGPTGHPSPPPSYGCQMDANSAPRWIQGFSAVALGLALLARRRQRS